MKNKAHLKYALECGAEHGFGGSSSKIDENDIVFVKDVSKKYNTGT